MNEVGENALMRHFAHDHFRFGQVNRKICLMLLAAEN